jgi:hypothetical protein
MLLALSTALPTAAQRESCTIHVFRTHNAWKTLIDFPVIIVAFLLWWWVGNVLRCTSSYCIDCEILKCRCLLWGGNAVLVLIAAVTNIHCFGCVESKISIAVIELLLISITLLIKDAVNKLIKELPSINNMMIL